MAEYIEREALRDSVESIDWYSVRRGELTTGAESSENALYKANDIYSAIDNAPTADVAPVVHGRWIYKGEYAVCTECGGRSGTQYDGVEPIPLMTQFCPNCGAKMDEPVGNSDRLEDDKR